MTPWEKKLTEMASSGYISSYTASHIFAAVECGVHTEHEFRLVLKAAMMTRDEAIKQFIANIQGGTDAST